MWRMALFSKSGIDVNEELTYDYNFSWYNSHEGQTCHCGADQCRGFIGGKGKKLAGQKLSGKNSGKNNTESKSSSKSDLNVQKDAKNLKQQQSDKAFECKAKANIELLNRSSLNHFAALKPMTATQERVATRIFLKILREGCMILDP